MVRRWPPRLSARRYGQAAIAAIAFAVFAAPYLIGSVLPAVAAWWPTAIGSMAGAVAAGDALSAPAVVGWAAGLGIVALVGLFAFDREDM